LSGVSLKTAEHAPRARVEIVFPREMEAIMPVWLEVLLNLSGYAGFVALATSGAACLGDSAEDETGRSKR